MWWEDVGGGAVGEGEEGGGVGEERRREPGVGRGGTQGQEKTKEGEETGEEGRGILLI